MLIRDFANRFKSAQDSSTNIDMEMLNLVSLEDNNSLIQPIQDSKIKEAIFRMDKYRTPGPDGFGAAFFQEVCTAVKSFLEEGKFLK